MSILECRYQRSIVYSVTHCKLFNGIISWHHILPLALHGSNGNYSVTNNNIFLTDGIAFISFRVLSTSTATCPRRSVQRCCCSASPGYRRHPSRRVVSYPALLPLLLPLRRSRKKGRSNSRNCITISNIIRSIFLTNWWDAIPPRPVNETSSWEGTHRRRRQKVVGYYRYLETNYFR